MSPKIKIVGLGLGDRFKNPKIKEMRVFGLSHTQIEISLNQIEAESFPKMTKKMADIFPIFCLMISYDFPMISP